MNVQFSGPKSKAAQGMANKAANAAAGKTEIKTTGFGSKKASAMTSQKAVKRPNPPVELKAQDPGPRSGKVKMPEQMSSARNTTTANRRTRY